ncbi:MAG: sucrase ferredoxin [Streptosporangiaceae bacterium]
MTDVCEHGTASHDGTESSAASAPEASQAWLLIEHPGPWPHEPTETVLPDPLGDLVCAAAELGIRVQMIRRPGRRIPEARGVYAGWTAGAEPWLRRASRDSLAGLDLEKLAAGSATGFGSVVGEPVFLVCTHAQRNACCARLGGPLVQALAARYPGQVFQTTHVGGHRFAANLVILPHGLYYGPVGVAEATAAIDAYQHGAVTAGRYRGRAGQPRPTQEAEHEALARAGSLGVGALA